MSINELLADGSIRIFDYPEGEPEGLEEFLPLEISGEELTGHPIVEALEVLMESPAFQQLMSSLSPTNSLWITIPPFDAAFGGTLGPNELDSRVAKW